MSTVLRDSIEIIPGRLYWYCNKYPPRNQPNSYFFNIDEILVYEPFNYDFGPLNLGKMHKFCTDLSQVLQQSEQNQQCKIFHHCSTHYAKMANACFLMGSFMVVCLGFSADEAWAKFRPYHKNLVSFRDASQDESCSYELTTLSCLRGLQFGMKMGWYNFKKFNLDDYDYFSQVSSGDMNWIVPSRFLALSSPTGNLKELGLTPEFYGKYFQQFGIRHVVRFNKASYEKSRFEK